MNLSRYPIMMRALGLSTVLSFWISAHAVAEDCAEPVATLVAIEGVVEVRAQSSTLWVPAVAGNVYCHGDMVRTQANSRAALHLNNNSIMRLSERATVTFTGLSPDQASWLDLKQGIAHFISRIRQRFEVITPYVNAAVEGTEFIVAVEETQAEVTVLEGRVRAKNDQGELMLTSGAAAVAGAGQAPVLRAQVKPWDAVSWALYYPPVIDFTVQDIGVLPEPWDARIANAVERYRQGNAAAALAEMEALPAELAGSRVLTYRAGLYLAAGRADAADADLDLALQQDAGNGEALALKSIIALVHNETAVAQTLAEQAVKASPDALAALLADSYAKQAMFDLEAARARVTHAVQSHPQSAMAWSRLAELHLMFGEHDAALQAAQRAAALSPDVARAQTVLGFVYLTRIDLDKAEQAFQRAIQQSQADPLPRQGLGLAMIRRGELESGRRQIEYAASLDPGDALIRSYLGKAYYEEKRHPLAADQFAMAQELDPKDPTPWYYDAIRKHSENRPVEALEDLQQASKLNDNRAVYRSRLLLDEDAAARSADLAQIYQSLGLDERALVEAWNSLAQDSSNHAPHLFLSESYTGLPRHEVARQSELLQARLLQPLNLIPVSPQLTASSLYLVDGTGPATASYNEYNSLFSRNGMRVDAAAVLGSDSTRGDELVLSGLHDRLSYSIGQYHYQTEGFRENNDLKHDIYNLFSQYAISPNLSVQLDAYSRKSESGDLELRFNPEDFSTSERRELEDQAVRLGMHYKPTATHDLAFLVTADDFEESLRRGTFSSDEQLAGMQAEGQHMFAGDQVRTTFGVGYLQASVESAETIDFRPLFYEMTKQDRDIDQSNTYFYAQVFNAKKDMLTLGLSYDVIDEKNGVDHGQFNPKLGLQLRPSERATLRMAAFRTLARKMLSKQTIEPVQVTGFNQFFEDTLGADAKRYGVAFDYTVSPGLFMGVELTRRDLTAFVYTAAGLEDEKQDERFHRVYIDFLPTKRVVAGASYYYEDFSRITDLTTINPDIPFLLTTRSLPLNVAYFHPTGFSANLVATYVKQDVAFGSATGLDEDKDDFWIADASLGYLLAHGRGQLKLMVKNLFDQNFSFQSTNFVSHEKRQSPYSPKRSYYLTVEWRF
ncbi:MAG: FecR domain-containing protein [Pseudomonadota bacterium]